MKIQPNKQLYICKSNELVDHDFIIQDLLYRGKSHSIIIFHFQDQVQAYLNWCVHMPRRLDCENNAIFNKELNSLRCSMHGIVYDPLTGESLSTLCQGKKLTKIKVQLIDDDIIVTDKRCRKL